MARLNIDTGIEGNSATGDTLRTAMNKINTNFEDVYAIIGDPSTGLLTTEITNGDIKVQPNGTGVVEIDQLQITDDDITSLITNGTVAITGNGTGGVSTEAIQFDGTELSSSDSTQITVKENLRVTGAQIDFTALPTSDPNVAGRLFRDGTDVKVSVG